MERAGPGSARPQQRWDRDSVEAWLDDHWDFTCSYFVRKGTREMVNAWFAEKVHTIPVCKEGTKGHMESCSCPSQPSPRAESSVPGTPARKISASEFDRPLRPIVIKDSEGTVSFLSDSDKKEQMPLTSPWFDNDEGDQCSRLLELVKDISSHLDVTALCHKIFLHIHGLISADRYSLFLVCEDSSNDKFLISRLFDVAEGSTLEEASNSCIHLEWNKGILGHMAALGEPFNIKDTYEVVGVAQAINKKSGNGGTFTEKDEKDFAAYLAFCGIVLHNAQLYETSLLENKRNQDSFSSVFHMECEELEESSATSTRERDANRINYMYAQHVKNTMEPLNIPDNENMGNINQQCIRSLLCTPIKNGKKNKVIGVCQLVNKMEETTGKVKPFNRNDKQFLEAFVIFCGLGIQNMQMYEAVERAMAKQMVTLEVLSYHASAAEEETRELQSLACTQRKVSQKAIQEEIRSVIRQITATVTFLPLLEVSYKDLVVPEKWEESGPQFISNSEEVRLRSFTTTTHKVNSAVAYQIPVND